MGQKGSKDGGGAVVDCQGRDRASSRSGAVAVEKRFSDVMQALSKSATSEQLTIRQAFEKKLSGGVAGFGERLHDAVLLLREAEKREMDAEALQLGFNRAFSTSAEGKFSFFWSVFIGTKEECTKAELLKMYEDVYALSVVGLNLEMVGLDERVLDGLVEAAPFAMSLNSAEVVTQRTAFTKWAALNIPALYVGVQNNVVWSLSGLLGQIADAIEETQQDEQRASGQSAPESAATTRAFAPISHRVPILETKSQVLKQADLWVLSLCIPTCFSTPLDRSVTNRTRADDTAQKKEAEDVYMWELLYNSNRDGTSVNRFRHHVFGYTGPTVLAIRDTSGGVEGICADTRWDDTQGLYGGKDSRAWSLIPMFSMIDPIVDELGAEKVDKSTNRASLYFKEKGRNQVHGIGIGRAVNNLRVYIDTDLQSGVVRLPKKINERDIKVAVVEVWGCGGPKASSDQEAQKAWESRTRERMLKVKRPGRENWLDNPDRAILEMGGVKVDHSERGDI